MSQSIQRTSITLLAGVLLLTLSACASRPIADPDSRTGRAGEKLSQAGKKLGEVSSDLWVKTKHVFRLDGTDAYHGDEAVAQKNPVEMPEKFKDEVDLALVQDEFETGPGNNDTVTLAAVGSSEAEMVEMEPMPVIEIVPLERSADASAQSLDTELKLGAAAANEELSVQEVAVVEDEAIIDEVKLNSDSDANFQPVMARADLEYEVQANENLWDISKRLTGDATNWQQLAALNSLDHNGTVYGGKTIQIPGDMLKPGINADNAGPTLAAATPAIEPAADSATESAPKRLKVPTATAVEAVSEVIVADASEASDTPAVPAGPSTSFKVQAGESMWEMAKRTTGDATNWKEIAAANNMTPEEAALIKYGQSLEIPDALLKKSVADEATAPAVAAATGNTEVEEAAPVKEVAAVEVIEPVATEAEATEASIEVASDAANDESMKIMPAKFQAEPTVINEQVAETDTAETQEADWVMVSGTYYPKAVYNDANFSATLLTRVSPGTKLQVSRAIGPWFEVKTAQGTGYVHSRDIK